MDNISVELLSGFTRSLQDGTDIHNLLAVFGYDCSSFFSSSYPWCCMPYSSVSDSDLDLFSHSEYLSPRIYVVYGPNRALATRVRFASIDVAEDIKCIDDVFKIENLGSSDMPRLSLFVCKGRQWEFRMSLSEITRRKYRRYKVYDLSSYQHTIGLYRMTGYLPV